MKQISDLLNQRFAVGILRFIGTIEGSLHFSLDLLPQGGHQLDVDIGFKQGGCDFLQSSVEDLHRRGNQEIRRCQS